MTRDFEYAASWGDVVLVLNWSELKKNLNFLPVAWFRSHPKKEREEFLYFKNEKERYKIQDDSGRMSKEQMEHFMSSVGEISLTEENFYGFYLRSGKYYSRHEVEGLSSHPKFLGFYER